MKKTIFAAAVFSIGAVASAAPQAMSCRLSKSVQVGHGWKVVATQEKIIESGGTLQAMVADDQQAQVHLSARAGGLVTLVLDNSSQIGGGSTSQGTLTVNRGVSLGMGGVELDSNGSRVHTSTFLNCEPVQN